MFESQINSKNILIILAASLVMAGCGGSSGGKKEPPPPANVAPTANAGADQTVDALAAVSLDGSGSSDTDGTVASYAWTQTTGTNVALDTAAPAMPTFTAPDVAADEDLTFSLVVTDNDGAASAADTVVVSVVANVAPTANAGPDQTVDSLDTVTLDGSGSSDPDGTVDVYTWTQTTGTAVTLDETVPAMPTFDAPNVGGDEVLTFELVVTDNGGAMSLADSVVITINPTLVLPFSDNFADGNSNGWTRIDDGSDDGNGALDNPSAWSAGTGRLVQTVSTNNFGGDVLETYRIGTYQWYNDSVNLTNYRFSVDATPLPGSADDVGVMFRYTDNLNYYRFSINSEAGSARLESRLNGTFMTLAHDFRGYLPNRLQEITIEVDGPLIQVFVNGNPLFAAHNTDHTQGGFGLYTRDGVIFDNVAVTVNDTDPEIVIASPEAHDVLPKGPRNVTLSAVARNMPAAGSVDLQMVGVACDAVVENPAGLYSALCTGVPVGNYLVRAILNDSGLEVDRDTNSDVAIGAEGVGDRYDAIGDSLTLGFLDRYSADNLNLNDQTTISFQGWAGPLGDMLSSANSQPNLVGNQGIPGDRVSDLRFKRLQSVLERNGSPRSNRALLLAGTNDTNDFNPTPSGLGCVGSGCNGTYNGDMQWIIQDLQARDRDTIYVATLPPIWGAGNAARDARIVEFNQVITTELTVINGVEQGPDFYSCFQTAPIDRSSLFEDSLHPNALGYAFMAALWLDAITGAPVVPPMNPCPAPIYILESLDSDAHGHKQNLMEARNEYYRDESFRLVNVPTELEDGIWVSQANADNANADADFLSFDAGPNPVTVYIAYDPATLPPTSSTHVFAALGAPLSSALTVNDPAVGTFSLVEATNVTGTVTIGGNLSGGGAPGQAYVVIVVP